MVGKHIKDRAFQREKCWMCPKSRTKCWVVGVIIKEYIIYRSRTIYYNYKLHIYIYIYTCMWSCDGKTKWPVGSWLVATSVMFTRFSRPLEFSHKWKTTCLYSLSKVKVKVKGISLSACHFPLFSLSFPLLSRLLFNFYVLFFLLSHSN